MSDGRDTSADHSQTPSEESAPTESAAAVPGSSSLPEGVDPEKVGAKEITLEDALQMGIRHHRAGRLPEAEYIYGKVLEAVPDQPDALHFSGVVAHQLGRTDTAIERIQSAIAAAPGHADMHNNLGRIYVEQGRVSEARTAFETAIELAPESADPWNNLGTLHKRAGRWKEAGEAFQSALQADPDHADAYQNLGNVFRRAGQHAEAAACFRRAIELKPDAAGDYQNLSQALWRAGQEDEARAAVQEWLAYEPESPVALHLASAFGLSETKSRASNEFVSQHFDEHAESFDDHLAELEYRAPERVFAMLAESVGWKEGSSPSPLEHVLDAGCGTGLCGPLLAPMTKRLVGVDLSPGMVERARNRGYDELVVAELTSFLQQHRSEYDAVVSADTLCYFGDLTDVTKAAYDALKPGGWFVFTVESLDAFEDRSSVQGESGSGGSAAGESVAGGSVAGESVAGESPRDETDSAEPEGELFRLLFHGRYAHMRRGLVAVLESAGFDEIDAQPEVLRMEVGEPVHGWLVRSRRP